MDRVLYTPHAVSIEELAHAYGWSYTKATTRAELDQALTSPVSGRHLVEVPLPR
jgi:2-succinyl-5-enolpyruvyl-6-hydroxy-3-cyclohexene-1-carboxylate synthase